MPGYLTGLLKSVNADNNRKLNILCFATHESFQTNLAKTGHNFFLFYHPRIKMWDYRYRDLPSNYFIIDGTSKIPADITIDLILSQSRWGQLQQSLELRSMLQVPIIHLEHVLPREGLDGNIRGDLHVFLTEYQQKAWGQNGPIIPTGIDTNYFSGWNGEDGRILTVVNGYYQRAKETGWELYKSATNGLPILPVGDTPGFSKPAPSLDILLEMYRGCGVYLNTTTMSTLPMGLLEAMSVGCPVVTTGGCGIKDFVKDTENGFIADDPATMTRALKWLLDPQNKDRAKKIGEEGRKTIIEKFELERFVKNWNEIFSRTVGTAIGVNA